MAICMAQPPLRAATFVEFPVVAAKHKVGIVESPVAVALQMAAAEETPGAVGGSLAVA